MAMLKKSLPLALSLVLSPSFAMADQVEETVVVADRVETAIESLAVSVNVIDRELISCLLYTSPSPRDLSTSRMPSSA